MECRSNRRRPEAIRKNDVRRTVEAGVVLLRQHPQYMPTFFHDRAMVRVPSAAVIVVAGLLIAQRLESREILGRNAEMRMFMARH